MQRLTLLLVLPLVCCIAACEQSSPPTAAARVPPEVDDTSTAAREPRRDTDITIGDVLKALDLQIWKARVNTGDSDRIGKTSLLVKRPGSDPEVVVEMNLPDDEAGMLLVCLQVRDDGQYKITLLFEGDEGRGGESGAVVPNPFAESFGISSSPTVRPGRLGDIMLISTGNDLGEPDAVALFVRNE